MDSYLNTQSRTWLVDEKVLDEIDRDLQSLINCTQKGDIVLFNTSSVIRPLSRVMIPWTLTLSGYVSNVDLVDGDFPHSTEKARFTCPRRNEGIFSVQAEIVTFANAVFEACFFDSKKGSRSIIEVNKCKRRGIRGTVRFHYSAFRGNRLINAVGLRLRTPACSSVEMFGVRFTNNSCSQRGCFAVLPSGSQIKRCTVYKNSVDERRDAMPSIFHVPAGSDTTIEEIIVLRNTVAVLCGIQASLYITKSFFFRNGFETGSGTSTPFASIHLSRSTVYIRDCTFKRNSGQPGAVLNARRSNIAVTDSSFEENTAFKGGAILLEKDSRIAINGTSFIKNSATLWGGCICAMDSTVHMRHVNAMENVAGKRGGCVATKRSDIILRRMAAAGNRVGGEGGSVGIVDSKLRVSNSRFTRGVASSGGFISAHKSSSVSVKLAWMTDGTAEGGGAISLETSSLKAEKLSISRCAAKVDGGALMGNASSRFLCSDCALRKNAAGRNGGAISFDSDREQVFAVNLANSRIELNAADRGGGIHFVSSRKDGTCDAEESQCPLIALTNNRFNKNEANGAGGGVFVGYLSAVRFRCGSLRGDNFPFYKTRQWETFSSRENRNDVCPEWRGNRAAHCGDNVGSYAVAAQMIVISKDGKTLNEWSKEQKLFKQYSDDHVLLPDVRLRLLDGLGQSPAIGHQPIEAKMFFPDGFLADAVTVSLEDGVGKFSDVRVRLPPGIHRVTIEFSEAVIKPLTLVVHVQQCTINEEISDDALCDVCDLSSYNFHPQEERCQPCPENANCETHVILPQPKFWHPNPCSKHVQKCLASEACKFNERDKRLRDLTEDRNSCIFAGNETKEYRQAQCTGGHTGPLCGSCEDPYGSSLSSTCKRCSNDYTNVCFIVFSVIGLLMFTSITMRGNLNVPSDLTNLTVGQASPCASQSSDLLAERGSPCASHYSEDNLVGVPELFETGHTWPSHHTVQIAEQNEQVAERVSKKVLAKWKAVEMLKITMTYVQVTVLITSIDAGWSLSMLELTEYAEFLGGLASEGIRRSVVCLSTDNIWGIHRMAFALIIDVCFVPTLAFCLLAVFWIVMTVAQETPSVLYLLKRWLLTIMVLCYVTFMPVMRLTSSLALCVDVYDSEDFETDTLTSYWAVDTELKCFDDTHSALTYILALSFVFPVYGGSILLFIVTLGSYSEKELLSSNHWVFESMSFLYRSYKSGLHRYWEVAIILKKACIAFFIFCAHRYESVTVVIATGIFIAIAMGAHALSMPYRKEFDVLNKFELSSLFVSLLTTLIAAMLKSDEYPDDHRRNVASVTCMLLNGITLFAFGYFVFRYTIQYIKLDLECEGIPDCSNAGVFRLVTRWVCHEMELLRIQMGLHSPVDPSNNHTHKISSGE